MKINTDNNNFLKKNLSNYDSFKTYEMKTSKNLMDLNEDTFNISNSPYYIYSKKKKSSIITKKEGKTPSNIILNNEANEGIFDNITTIPKNNLNLHNSLKDTKISKDIEIKKTFEKINPKKRVKFKEDFVTVIEIQSYKKFNVPIYLNNNNNNNNNNNCSLKCSCEIF